MEELNNIINVLEKIETNNLSEDPETKNWLNQITDSEFGLVSSCIDLLLENISNPSLTKNIILVLRKMYFYHPIKVISQIKKSKDFIKGVSKYLTTIKPEDSTPEIFVLLHEFVFDDENHRKDSALACSQLNLPENLILDTDFNNSCLNYIGQIDSEDTMNKLVKIITYMHFTQACLFLDMPLNTLNKDNDKDEENEFLIILTKIIKNSLNYSTKETIILTSNNNSNSGSTTTKNNNYNILLKLLPIHNKFKLFLECLLRILVNNSFSKKDSLYVMLLILDLMNYTNSSMFFIADIESLVDFSIKRLESTSTDIIRDLVLSILERVTFYPGYNKSFYKKSLLEELMENHIDSDLVTDEQKTICEKIIKNFNIK